MTLTPDVLESFTAFCDAFRIDLFDHQREDFGIALRREGGRFVHRLGGISWPRGDGKSWADAAADLWRLLCGPAPQDIINVALDRDGGRVVLDHARAIVRSRPELDRAIEFRANALLVPATGSRWTVESREETSTRGRHPTFVSYDEGGHARDAELFAALLAGQASVADPFLLMTSTVGRRQSGPLWTIKTLAEGGDEGVCWRWSGTNRSPLVTSDFLERQRRILLPGQFAREHQNAWTDAADSFTTAALVDTAMGRGGWTEQTRGRPCVAYVWYVDIGSVHDPTVIAIGHDEAGTVYIDRLITFAGSREQPVQMAAVEQTIREVARHFPPRTIQVETWQGIASAQRLQGLGLPVVLFTPTAKSNSEQWPLLASKLATGTIVLFPHARLRDELLNLVYEVGASGVRVIDRGKVHQDHAVAVRGVVAQLTARACPYCADPDCEWPLPPFGLHGSPEVSVWTARHSDPDGNRGRGVTLGDGEAELDLTGLAEAWDAAVERGDFDEADKIFRCLVAGVEVVERGNPALGPLMHDLLHRMEAERDGCA